MQQRKSFFRRFSNWVLLFALIVGALGGVGLSVRAEPVFRPLALCPSQTIAEWTFSNVITPFAGSGTFSVGAGIGNQSFPSDASSDSPSISFNNWNSATLDATDYLDVAINTIGRANIELKFKYSASSTGPTTLELHYSTGGTTFTQIVATPLITDGAFHELKFPLSSSQVSNVTNLHLRLYAYGATDANGTLAIDNLTVTGNCPPLTVIISEVAWAGTAANTDHEWLELYNPGSTDIPLDGWRIEATDGNPNIVIPDPTSGDDYVIVAGGFFLLERNEDAVANIAADLVYDFTYTLSNSGESLILFDSSSNAIDTANSNGGAWPAGDVSNFSTMERIGTLDDNDTSWRTNLGKTQNGVDANGNPIWGTPKNINAPTPTATTPPTNTPVPPTPVGSLAIVISEVSWGGTIASGDDEWIELYNRSNVNINLTGWTLSSTDGSPTIDGEFDGIILESGEYLLLERGDDDTITVLPTNFTCPSIIYQGTLNNTGEKLVLEDSNGTIVDTANTNGGAWPAGTLNNSMQRSVYNADSDYTWVSYDRSRDTDDKYALDANGDPIRGTPCRGNLPFNVTPTITPSPTRTPIRSGSSGTIGDPILVISEFLPRPGTDWNNDGQVDVFDEFIEVINGGSVNVTLSAYRLDDEEDEGSSPFSLPNTTLRPGERAVFYAAQTGILLSDAGDTVRLLRGSTVVDAYTYDFARYPDQSWCRSFDSYGDWITPCFPTPNNPNALTGNLPRPSGPSTGHSTQACLLPDTAPEVFVYAECEAPGGGIWNRQYWDGIGLFKWLIPYIDQRLVDFFE